MYFGRGAYGIQAAAQTYFNKTAAELNVGESAVLTSLIRNPTGYDPIKYPKVAAERRRVVLLRMVEAEGHDAGGSRLHQRITAAHPGSSGVRRRPRPRTSPTSSARSATSC